MQLGLGSLRLHRKFRGSIATGVTCRLLYVGIFIVHIDIGTWHKVWLTDLLTGRTSAQHAATTECGQ